MMLFLSGATALLIVLGFVLNGQAPFEAPISLLVERPYPWAYPAILLSMIITISWFGWTRALSGGRSELLLPGLVSFLLGLLIFVDYRVQPAHDNLSAFLMFLSSAFLCHLSIELGHRWLTMVLSLSALSLPLLFTRNLTAIAMVELTLLSWSLILLNVSCHAPPSLSFRQYSLRSGGAKELLGSAKSLLGTGSRMRGYAWACFAVFFTGISGVYAGAPLAGVLHFAICWCAGYLSKRFDHALINHCLFLASGIAPIFVLSGLTKVTVRTTVLPVFALCGAVLLVTTFQAQAAKLRS